MRNINEGTQASIIVKVKNKWKVSLLQYDGGVAISILKSSYKTQKKAEMLVQKTGELRGLGDGGAHPDYYNEDNMLEEWDSLDDMLDHSELLTYLKCIWDGKKWYEDIDNKKIYELIDDAKKLEKVGKFAKLLR